LVVVVVAVVVTGAAAAWVELDDEDAPQPAATSPTTSVTARSTSFRLKPISIANDAAEAHTFPGGAPIRGQPTAPAVAPTP
jgi:hypothetical protein